MYTRFYDNTVVTRFIKQLVATTNVPFVSTWKPGDFAIRGMVYLSQDALWRCQHTGYPEHLNDVCTLNRHTTILDEKYNVKDVGSLSSPQIRYFKRVGTYVFGEKYSNITGSYKSNILGYDSTTHYYLGQYLRMMRDVYNLDLMPFYNCFDGTYMYDIDFDAFGNVYSAKEAFYKIYSVPVKFGKTYTIAIDSGLPVEVMCVIYGPKGVIEDKTQNLNDGLYKGITTPTTATTYCKYNYTEFRHPFTYRTKDWHQVYNVYSLNKNNELSADDDDVAILNDSMYDQGLGQFERYLRLLIKVPKSNTSSLVVIEGDYSLDPTIESANTNSVTWTNQGGVDITVNSQRVTGEWVRPLYNRNFELKRVVHIRDRDKDTDFYHPIYPVSFDSQTLEPVWPTVEQIIAIIRTLYNVEEISEADIQIEDSEVSIVQPMFSPLGLLQLSDGHHYAFSDRLVEYLLQHAINHLDSYGKNIQRIQEYAVSVTNKLKNRSTYNGKYTPGVWDDSLKAYLFKLVSESTLVSRKIDITGYVDKETEKVITRGQKV